MALTTWYQVLSTKWSIKPSSGKSRQASGSGLMFLLYKKSFCHSHWP